MCIRFAFGVVCFASTFWVHEFLCLYEMVCNLEVVSVLWVVLLRLKLLFDCYQLLVLSGLFVIALLWVYDEFGTGCLLCLFG